MSNIFQQVATTAPSRSRFDLSHEFKFSCNMGELVPTMCLECVPGDVMNLSAQALVRFAPLIAPMMHRVNTYIHYFFVPNRLVWDNWENFITSTKVGDPAILPPVPYISYENGSYEDNKLLDYFGLPKPIAGSIGSVGVSAFPFAAYNKIWNNYYRQEYIQDEIVDSLSDGSNNLIREELCKLRTRAWMHDYFTSALPFSQKGDQVEVPIGDIKLKESWYEDGDRPVWDTHLLSGEHVDDFKPNDVAGDSGFPSTNPASDPYELGGEYRVIPGTPDDPARRAAYDPKGSLYASAVTINELRRAESLQTFLELLARGGSRYNELIYNFFKVHAGDARLQRPEYICGVKAPVQVSEVLNTTGNDGELPQGNMAGHGASVVNGKAGTYFCKEHGFIIGIMSVTPDTAYYQGVPKMWNKPSPTDYFFPQFEGLGEQPIYNREVYADFGTDGLDLAVFGYAPRYADYKYMNSRIAGDFKESLSYWTLARKFDERPTLSPEFIECRPRHDIFAVTDPNAQKLYVHLANRVGASRPMKKFTIPRL